MKQAGRSKNIVLGLALGLLSTGVAFAANEMPTPAADSTDKLINFDIAVGTELMSGDTTYSIGGPVHRTDGSSTTLHFPLSELEWPLDFWSARVDAGITVGSSWRINGILKKNISDPDDPMKDSDWGINYLSDIPYSSPTDLDVYSESNISDFDALIWDIDIEWIFLQRKTWNLYTGLGYQYQKFEYDAQAIHQYSPSGLAGVEYYGDGSVWITYEMTYKMPYLLLGTNFQITPAVSVAGNFSYSPWVNAEDEDHHLLRNKVARGDMDGDAYMIELSGTYNFLSSWFLKAGFHYTKIDVDGDQNQAIYGVPYATIHVESESVQTSGYLNVGYRF